MFKLSVRDDIRSAKRKLNRLQKKQLPFAISKALNDVAFSARRRIINVTYPAAFEVRNKRFIRAVLRVKKSNKRLLKSSVFDALGREYLKRHAVGGEKRGRGGSLAIPSTRLRQRRTGRGVPKQLRPRTAINSGKAFKARSRKSGQLMIFERKGTSLRVLYILKNKATIKKTFNFYSDLVKLGRQRFPVFLRRSLKLALRTAR